MVTGARCKRCDGKSAAGAFGERGILRLVPARRPSVGRDRPASGDRVRSAVTFRGNAPVPRSKRVTGNENGSDPHCLLYLAAVSPSSPARVLRLPRRRGKLHAMGESKRTMLVVAH